MELPLLPKEAILTVFILLKRSIPDKEAGLKTLIVYFEIQWISSNIFLISNWSIFNEEIRTNNDLEGWHFRFNRKVIKSLYYSITLLRIKNN